MKYLAYFRVILSALNWRHQFNTNCSNWVVPVTRLLSGKSLQFVHVKKLLTFIERMPQNGGLLTLPWRWISTDFNARQWRSRWQADMLDLNFWTDGGDVMSASFFPTVVFVRGHKIWARGSTCSARNYCARDIKTSFRNLEVSRKRPKTNELRLLLPAKIIICVYNRNI